MKPKRNVYQFSNFILCFKNAGAYCFSIASSYNFFLNQQKFYRKMKKVT